ncbi:hypothetical protein K1719_023569 [Acacia pycnantha]|nr:hypothetical protein K1719_023569 [Acacia pycnantha]
MGSNGIFTGFSSEFLGRAWDSEKKEAKTIVGSQSGKGIIKLDGSIKLSEPKLDHSNGMALNCLEVPLDIDIKDGRMVVVLNTMNLHWLVRGSGCVQVVGLDGERVLETIVKAGNLFIVPRFHVVLEIVNPDGMKWFSIIATQDKCDAIHETEVIHGLNL